MRDPTMDEAAIHTVLSRVLLAGGLPGGTRLGENHLASLFGVSRERIRKVLHRLGHERLLEIVKNRGAFTIAPDLREAHVIYEARRILEAGIAAHLADNLTDAQIERIRDHVDREAAALSRGDRSTWIKLSGEFHLVLAEMTSNPIILRQAKELVGRTVMLVTVYENGAASMCGCEEHRAIFQALARRERSKAVRAMSSHLSLVETRLKPVARATATPSLENLLANELKIYLGSCEQTH
jgi:DNA-binding GntR family transcriptional regulator